MEVARIGQVVGAADFLQPGQRHQLRLGIVAHAARIVEGDVPDVRVERFEFEQLVDLFLVFDHGEGDFGVFHYIRHVGRRRILVQRHRDAPQALRSQHRPVEARTVVADDGQVHAALKTERRQTAGQGPHFFIDVKPAPGLPDA